MKLISILLLVLVILSISVVARNVLTPTSLLQHSNINLSNGLSYNDTWINNTFIPYTGAVNNVDLGDNTLTATDLIATNSLIVDTDTLYVESIDKGRVGIGTSSPTTKLQVVENFAGSGGMIVENENTGTLAATVVRLDGSDGNTNLIIGSNPDTRWINPGWNFISAINEGLKIFIGDNLASQNEIARFLKNGIEFDVNTTIDGDLTATSVIETTPTLFKLDQSTPQTIDFEDGTGLSFDTVDLVGGGMGVFPRMKFSNSNVVDFPQDLGLIDRGLVIQDDNNEPLLAFAGDSIATKKIGAIAYDSSVGSESFIINLDVTDEDLDEDSRVIWLTNAGTFFVGGGKFTTKLNANTGLKEGIELQGKFLSGVSAAGEKTAIKFTDRVGTGFGIERTTGYIAGVLNNNAEATFQGGLELGVFNLIDVNNPIKAIEINGVGDISFSAIGMEASKGYLEITEQGGFATIGLLGTESNEAYISLYDSDNSIKFELASSYNFDNDLTVIGNINTNNNYYHNENQGFTGSCINTTYSGGIAISCND